MLLPSKSLHCNSSPPDCVHAQVLQKERVILKEQGIAIHKGRYVVQADKLTRLWLWRQGSSPTFVIQTNVHVGILLGCRFWHTKTLELEEPRRPAVLLLR